MIWRAASESQTLQSLHLLSTASTGTGQLLPGRGSHFSTVSLR